MAVWSQSITGVWEGLVGEEYLKLNIRQEGRRVCGHSYDVEVKNKNSFCRAYFTGELNEKSGIWTLKGRSFIDNSGGHVLMTIKLWAPEQTERKVLRAAVVQNNLLLTLMNLDQEDMFWLRQVSPTPLAPPGKTRLCLSDDPPKKPLPAPTPGKTARQPKIPGAQDPSPRPLIDSTALPSPVSSAPAPPPAPRPPVAASDKSVDSARKRMESRSVRVERQLTVKDRKVTLRLYDNGVVDNDTISVFYNGRLIRSKERLTERPVRIELFLEPDANEHMFTIFAENNGEYPPNTALIVVESAGERFEFHSSATLQENAAIQFRYAGP